MRTRLDIIHRPLLAGLTLLLSMLAWCGATGVANAQQVFSQVFVEGATDTDGDGRLGVDEDNDGDNVFGTLNAAIRASAGRVVIRSSGNFYERIIISTPVANPNLQFPPETSSMLVIEAAPGVDASIEAFDPSPSALVPNATRRELPGVHVQPNNGILIITLRNLTVRNWRTGIQVDADSTGPLMLIENCRVESCWDRGVFVDRGHRLAMRGCTVADTGIRFGGNFFDGVAFGVGEGVRIQGSVIAHLFDNTLVGNNVGIKAKGAFAKGNLVQSNNLVLNREGLAFGL